MKVTELRIGNYAFDSDRDDPYFYQIVRIETKEYTEWNSGDAFNVIGKREGSENGYYEMNPSPIPLTEEWLERFGFEWNNSKIGLHIDFGTSKTLLWYADAPNKIWLTISSKAEQVNVNGVHQLQNLYFALTGEELQTDETDQKVNL